MHDRACGPGREEARIRVAYARRHDRGVYSWFSPGHVCMMQERERRLLAALTRAGILDLKDCTVLEVGCGSGQWLRDFVKWGARPEHTVGVDLLPERIKAARELCATGTKLFASNAMRLNFDDATFDIVLQSTVFTSILDEVMRRQVAREMLRVVRPHGVIVWYDYRVDNPWNRDVRGLSKREIRELFPSCEVELQPITLVPPLTRMMARYTWLGCHLLSKLPFLCTHYLGVIKKCL